MDFVRRVLSSLTMVGAILSPPVAAADWTGLYAASDGTTAIQVHLVEAPDGRILGRFRHVGIGQGHRVADDDAPITGQVNGDLLAGTIDGGFLRGSSSITARKTQRGIDISGSGGLSASLIAISETDARAQVAAIHGEAAMRKSIALKNDQKAKHAERVRRVANAVERIQRQAAALASSVEQRWSAFAGNEAKYQAAARGSTDRWNGAAGDQARRRAATANLHQRIDELEHPHIKVRQLHESILRDAENIEGVASELAAPCAELASYVPACLGLPSVFERVSSIRKASTGSFRPIEEAYQREMHRFFELLGSR